MSCGNEYVERYGQKAMEIYKRTQNINHQSTNTHLKQSRNRKYHPSKSNPKAQANPHSTHNHSHSHLKSVCSVNKISSNRGKRSKVIQIGNNFGQTANQKKKLIISEVQTPKCSTPIRNSFNLPNDNQSKRKKCFKYFQSKLQCTLKDGRNIKQLLDGLIQCIEIVAIEDERMKRMFNLLKQAIQKISIFTHSYKKKYKMMQQKLKQFQRQKQHNRSSSKQNKLSINNQLDFTLLQQNNDLRSKVKYLQTQLQQSINNQQTLIRTLDSINRMQNGKYPQNVTNEQVQEHQKVSYRKCTNHYSGQHTSKFKNNNYDQICPNLSSHSSQSHNNK